MRGVSRKSFQLLLFVIGVSSGFGCRSEDCEKLSPRVQVSFSLGSGIEADQIFELQVLASLNGANDKKISLSPEETGLRDGSNQFVIIFGSAAVKEESTFTLVLSALDKNKNVLATTHFEDNPKIITPDGCNFVSFVLEKPGALSDANSDLKDGSVPPNDTIFPKDGISPKYDQLSSDLPQTDANIKPNEPCRSLELLCLDHAPANIIDVPTEATGQQAFNAANAGDTIQIRGMSLDSEWWIPPYVTLRGCNGAKIIGAIGFEGSGGVVEGFEVSGQIVANKTGDYVVRYNNFVTASQSFINETGVSARSIDALVSASVNIVVDSNWFEKRNYGIEARTKYDTFTHSVNIEIRNNIFSGVNYPVEIMESGLVGKIEAILEHNTIYDFDKAIGLFGIDQKTVTLGNLFVKGDVAVSSNSPYEVNYSFSWQVNKDYDSNPPFPGSFAKGDPAFVNATGGDFRLKNTSFAIDQIPTGVSMPAEDYFGCPRPVGFLGVDAKGDVGALEAQPY
ncbi:MAG: hypothetical protein V1754_05655 [Pseudomonadota bacterium]